MTENNPIFDGVGDVGSDIRYTLQRLKTIEPGTYLAYKFSNLPEGLFLIAQRDLQAVVERFEAYESALAAIRDSEACAGECAAIAAYVLPQAPSEEPGRTPPYEDREQCAEEDEFDDLGFDYGSIFSDLYELDDALNSLRDPVEPNSDKNGGTDWSN